MQNTAVIMFFNNKGGTGKSTTSLNQAAALSEMGRKVVFIDMDESTNSTTHLRDRDSREICFPISTLISNPDIDIQDCILWKTKLDNVGLIPSDTNLKATVSSVVKGSEAQVTESLLRVKNKIKDLDGLVDYIIIDIAPSIDHTVTMGLLAATHIVFVLDGSAWAENGVVNTLRSELMQKVIPVHNPGLTILGAIYNNINPRSTNGALLLNRDFIADNVPVLDFYIPQRQEIEDNTHLHEFAVKPGSTKPSILADQYRNLAAYIDEQIFGKEDKKEVS